ncbi:zinc finger protein CONSTANS-LIKE 16 [Mercurialis annua]|uniref:zinc finger protein CONSTANS-LIKE 16 n=1 Tax=Mercurialis annua TaxID=3986 RepID=UPI00215F8880|nr:zinc finger protein CONSTANS-LIKE 16 [Mercurialis annua]
MIVNKNVANAVGGKTARACDSCIRKRARWYCAADDAFLCQSCDLSVHSANPLARRHERVRLKIASLKSLNVSSKENSTSVPSWHRGFTRKARTPRNHGNKSLFSLSKIEEKLKDSLPIVPEVGSDDQNSQEDNNEEEQLLYRVPIFDPFVAELCSNSRITVSNEEKLNYSAGTVAPADDNNDGAESKGCYNLQGFLPSEMDLAEFAADVESLLGRGLENESFGMEDLGLVDCKEICSSNNEEFEGKVKLEDEVIRECDHVDNMEIDLEKEAPFELSFDYDSATCGEEDDRKIGTDEMELKNIDYGDYEDDGENKKSSNIKKKRRKILLNLDYEAVMTAWASQGTSPWTNGHRPDINPDECWSDYTEIYGVEYQNPYGDLNCLGGGGGGGNPAMAGGGREARVSRYREKRRTRLFSKKIRYEVRKLNAEKRPRMKGRFVKRTPFSGAAFPIHTK